MQSTLQFSALLIGQLELSRVNVRAENALVKSLQRQSNLAYQMKLFCEYARVETKGLVTIRALRRDDEQFKRCKKAIKDNINGSFLREGGFQGIRVLNVFHLRNDRLSKLMQVRL